MAIAPMQIRLILREHLRQPFTGPVLQLGRQRIGASYEQVVSIFREEGVEPRALPAGLPVQGMRPGGLAEDSPHNLTDIAFFGMLGLDDVKALDFSPVDNPDILADLNEPVPEELHGRFDLVVDGGTFDHVFDLRQAFVNVADMLRSGGRVMHWNAASNQVEVGAYCSFSPSIFLDYYEQNGFADCQAFVAVRRPYVAEEYELFEYNRTPNAQALFLDPRPVISIIWAAKTEASTTRTMPTQAAWLVTPDQQAALAAVARPSLRARLFRYRQSHPLLTALPSRLWRTLRSAWTAFGIWASPKTRPSAYRHLGRF